MNEKKTDRLNVLITGASGYIGSMLVEALANDLSGFGTVVATDVRPTPEDRKRKGIVYETLDVRDAGLGDLLAQHKIDAVAHLASIVTPGKDSTREFEYSVDVGGTKNVLESCLKARVSQIIVTSSGAAYGYYPDNPEWIVESDAIRGNATFAYSDHKRIVEEMLADYRRKHPKLKQLVFRPGTILGQPISNQITNLFEKKVVLGIAGSPTPFVIIWDEDVVGCILKGLRERTEGIYNLAGDGAVPLKELARYIGKPFIPLPAWLVQGLLGVLHPLGISRYGPNQVDFIRYRPVLSNAKLKKEFGYPPRKTSMEVFEFYWKNRNEKRKAEGA